MDIHQIGQFDNINQYIFIFLHSLQKIMHDVDFTLLPSLLEGVRTGFSEAIPPSGIFPPKNVRIIEPDPLSAHLSNWQSAGRRSTINPRTGSGRN